MIDLLLNTRAFEGWAKQIEGEAKQLPFALAGAMNVAAFEARRKLIDETWPSHVEVRNRNFLRAALRVEKANKANLSVVITDAGIKGRGHLRLHADGGTKRAKKLLAIPDRKVRRGSKGVVPSQRPTALPNSFRRGDAIYQRTGRKGRGKLKLMYVLKPTARIKADVPFRQDFKRYMLDGLRKSFPDVMANAMRLDRVRRVRQR